METSDGARRWGAAAVGAGLGLLELALVRLAGPPARQVEVLRQLGEVGADPLASLLALLALAAEGLPPTSREPPSRDRSTSGRVGTRSSSCHRPASERPGDPGAHLGPPLLSVHRAFGSPPHGGVKPNRQIRK
jgi:hypothetical protein